MTRDEILNMPANELNQHIYLSVMTKNDWKPWATDIAAAWEVVETLNQNGIFVSVSNNFLNAEEKDWLKGGYICEICVGWDKEMDFVEAESAPLAICRAALLAVMENENAKNG